MDGGHKNDPTNALQSIEAEQMVLGSLLVRPDQYFEITSLISEAEFYDPVHAKIWSHIAARHMTDDHVSPVTIKADMVEDDGLKALGGPAYLAKLAGSAPPFHDVKEYARLIKDMADRRNLANRLAQISDELSKGRPAGDAVAEIEMFLHQRQDNSEEPRSKSLLKAHTEAMTQANDIAQGNLVGIPTGLDDLDAIMSLMPKRYTVLAGATSMGKSAIGIWLSYAAAKAGFGVGFVSREMPETDIANRINSIDSKIPYKAFDRPMSETVFRQALETAKAQEGLPIEIFSDRVQDIASILSEAKRLKRKWQPNGEFKGLKLLVVDYIQLIKGKGESAFVRLSSVANEFKDVAKMLDVHVLCLAQIDRTVGDRDDPRPRLSDLRGTGDLENAPDNVAFIYRPEHYLVRKTPPKKLEERADWEAELARAKGKAEIIVAKARMGEIDSVSVCCDVGTNRFWNDTEQEGFEF